MNMMITAHRVTSLTVYPHLTASASDLCPIFAPTSVPGFEDFWGYRDITVFE